VAFAQSEFYLLKKLRETGTTDRQTCNACITVVMNRLTHVVFHKVV